MYIYIIHTHTKIQTHSPYTHTHTHTHTLHVMTVFSSPLPLHFHSLTRVSFINVGVPLTIVFTLPRSGPALPRWMNSRGCYVDLLHVVRWVSAVGLAQLWDGVIIFLVTDDLCSLHPPLFIKCLDPSLRQCTPPVARGGQEAATLSGVLLI